MAKEMALSTARQKRPPTEGRSAVELISDRYADLSPAHRKLADYILSSPHEAALMTLERLARGTGISIATANRLGSALGLNGYPEFKALLRAELRSAIRPAEEFVDGLRISRFASAAPWTQSMEQDIQRIHRVAAVGGDSAFTRACSLLANQRRVFILGFGSSAFIAQYAAFNFSSLRNDCRAVTDSSGIEGAARVIADAGPSDVALQLAFARYSEANIGVARHFKQRRVPLIAITDAADSPIGALASEKFIVERKSGFVLTGGGAGAVAVIEALLHGTTAIIGVDEVERRVAQLTSNLGDAITPP